MKIFSSESEMQEWLSSAIESTYDFQEIIVNHDTLHDFSPQNLSEQKIYDSYKSSLEALSDTTVFSENENISLDRHDGLKPDFVLYSASAQCFVIIELKNIPGPTRQAGTELNAYASEIRTWMPLCADGDIVYVIVSMDWPALLKHYIRHEIFWQSRNLICLQPCSNNGKIGLEIVDPRFFSEDLFSFKICDRHIGGYHICLYDKGRYSKNPDLSRLDKHIEQMKCALQQMAQQGNILKSHGFSFLWKDNWAESLSPYLITTVNVAPIQSVERFFKVQGTECTGILERFAKLIREHDPQGHGESLNRISKTCYRALDSFCSPQPEGFHDWGALKNTVFERGELIAFSGWGIFGEEFYRQLSNEHKSGNISCSSMSPEIGLRAINEILDENYQFIDLSWISWSDDEEFMGDDYDDDDL